MSIRATICRLFFGRVTPPLHVPPLRFVTLKTVIDLKGAPPITMPNIATSAAQFDPAYLAAQPKPVQTLMAMPWGVPKVQLAKQLALQGYVIDNTIMLWAWDAYTTTVSRQQYSYAWVPSLLMPPVQIAPGEQSGTLPPYEANIVPQGGILVTLDLDLLPGIFTPVPGSSAAQALAQAKVDAAVEAKKPA